MRAHHGTEMWHQAVPPRGVKISFYDPPDVARMPSRIGSVEELVGECIPRLRDGRALDRSRLARHRLQVRAWVGRVLAQLALRQGTAYDIGRFTPARFGGIWEGVAS